MTNYEIAVIPGDGVGPEVVNEGIKVLRAVEELYDGINFEFVEIDAGAHVYKEKGYEILPDDFERCRDADAIYLGAIGLPGVNRPDGTIVGSEVLLALRFKLDLYVNLRPIKLYPGVKTPLADKKPEDIDFYVVRENTEDVYAGIKGRVREDVACDVKVTTRKGAERIIRYAFELARREERKRVTCCDKSNVIGSCAFFREIFTEISKEYPEIETDYAYVDAITQWFVRTPEWYEVVVAPNMFGDIISDLGAAIAGGMGIAPSANIGDEHAMFEPVHGSAPKYTGQYKVNPVAAVLCTKMMMDYFGRQDVARLIDQAVTEVLREGKVRTYDLGGNSKTYEVGDAIVKKMKELYE
jgi:3-isopropylmalate dehydrogenase